MVRHNNALTIAIWINTERERERDDCSNLTQYGEYLTNFLFNFIKWECILSQSIENWTCETAPLRLLVYDIYNAL